ncbi:efflux transporter outer membrane subunit [Azospirillum sp. TSO35-2]|uniref:efflux transporter outer membrane subunit n=1 Tax=Azospirillum sp. TSO35-2 TaxID=716796 RepID=UPI000D60A4BA|nr:efflux transporter outer membrane subunit [Azospirillum sp. TSO35-2]PWC33355.1 RND transporter [Azospirillum sp. TSO35-2]
MRAILLASLLMLAGCSMTPELTLPAAPVAASYPGATMANAAGVTKIEWRRVYPDPRLQKLIELALTDNRSLRIALLQAAEARSQLRIARSAQLPSVAVEGGYNRQRTSVSAVGSGQEGTGGTVSNQFTVQAGLASFEIDLFGRLASLSEAAFQRYLSSEEGARAARLAVIGTVAEAYLAERLGDEQLALVEATLKDWRSSLDITRRLRGASQTGGTEVAQAEGLVRQAEADLEQRRRERDQATNALVLAVGAPLPSNLPPSIPLMGQPIEAQLTAGLPSDLLLRRPDILQAEHELKAANADVGAARAAFFPRLSLTAQYGFESQALGSLFAGANQAWSFAPQITAPIFQAGALQGNLDASKVRKDTAVARYEQAIQSAFREVADGLAARATYSRQRAAQAEAATVAERRQSLADMRYRAGLDSRLDLLDAQRGVYAARQALLEVRRQELASTVGLYRALGGDAKP